MTTSAASRHAPQTQERRERWFLRLMSAGFGVGSTLFGLGAAWAMAGNSVHIANEIFTAGAVCFTFAALVQLVSSMAHLPVAPHPLRRAVTDPDVVSSVIQFIGTLWFNVMTIRSVVLPTVDYEQVWGPDVYGSACFLISSWIAWHPIVRIRRHGLVVNRSRVILWANMLGSIFFAISAWGAKLIRPGTFENSLWANLGTLLGAIGFLVAAVLLWPPRKGNP